MVYEDLGRGRDWASSLGAEPSPTLGELLGEVCDGLFPQWGIDIDITGRRHLPTGSRL